MVTNTPVKKEVQKQLQKTVSFYALGCRANQLEASSLADTFKANGWQIVPFGKQPSQLVVINTCTVTHGADSDSRYVIRKAIRQNPNAKIAVTGCYAQISPDEIAQIGGVDFVIGNNYKQDIYHIVQSEWEACQKMDATLPLIKVDEMDKSRMMMGASSSSLDRSRASLKIQDGCDFQCTYCIIWVARGKSRSLPTAEIQAQLKQLVTAGFYEIVLTGINIGQYQDPDAQTDLTTLLKGLLAIPLDFRIRLSSLDPFEVTPELIALMAENPKLCSYLHLSIQSAEDHVLKRMARRHRISDVFEICQEVKHKLPNACIGADIIVGFPEETPERFETTYTNLKALALDYFHVFSYSKREGTPAADFAEQVSDPEKKRRSQLLIELSKQKQLSFYQSQLGQTLSVIPEQNGEKGLSENYISVQFNQAQLGHHPIQAKLTTVTPEEAWVEVLPEFAHTPQLVK